MDISLSLTGLLALIGKLFKSVWDRLRPPHTPPPGMLGPIPQTTIIIAQAGPYPPKWQLGEQTGPKGKEPVMILDARFTITNMSTYNVRLQAVELKIGRLWAKKFSGHLIIQRGGSADEHDMIDSGHLAEVLVLWHIAPPIRKAGKKLTADVAIFDNFRNPHLLKHVTFTPS